MRGSTLNRQEIIPTLVSYSPTRRAMVVGEEARSLGIKGHTNAHDFKMQVGNSPAEFDKKGGDRKGSLWVQIPGPDRPPATTFSCREITTIFLKEVLGRCIGRYEKIMVGYPAVQSEAWAQNYRSNLTSVLQTLGFAETIFLPEPFAVFQYYRHVEKLIPEERRSQVICLIDIGGGTCNTCIVKTTGGGMISERGYGSKPYGTTAAQFGGKALDLFILQAALDSRKDLRGFFKENPIERARNSLPALLKIEDAKLRICAKFAIESGSSYQQQTEVQFEPGELAQDRPVSLEVNSSHINIAVRNAWTNQWLPTVTSTIKEAEKQLKTPINEIDKIILCGGCGQVPYLRNFVAQNLGKWLRSNKDVVVGNTPGFAVARGIEKECEIRAGKDPSLLANDLGRWALSAMYLGVRHTRVEKHIPVKINNATGNPYLLVPEWTRLDAEVIERDIELPFVPENRLFFGVFDRPIGSGEEPIPLNLQQDTIKIPAGIYRNKAKFLLRQTSEGALGCEIVLYRREQRSEVAEHLKLPEFFPLPLRVHSGKSVLGLDFGTSNTYLVELNLAEEPQQTDYFSFRVRPRVKDSLAELQTSIARVKQSGLLESQVLQQDAYARRVDFVCHSVKLEGQDVSRGETQDIVDRGKQPASKGQYEAKYLGEAYQWMLENYDQFLTQPEAFARELNKRLLNDLHIEAGRYRTGAVKIRTKDGEYFPPDGPLVPSHMRDWGAYVRHGPADRSPLEFAAALHSIFVRIHPFADGNGRTARLLVNAFLLTQGLPIVVITIDDRERYVDGLAESDGGSGDGFTTYLIELIRESLEGLQIPAVSGTGGDEAIVDVSLEDDDPLAEVMGRLIERDRLPAKKIYEPWRVTFEGLKGEMDIVVNQFNDRYLSDGYQAKLTSYDILSEDKFSRLFLGLAATKTWFFGLELRSHRHNERFMFFFQHESASSKAGDEGSVVLKVSRYDGDEFRNLTPEVFQPCQIVWQDGSIQLNWEEASYRSKPLRYQVAKLFAELIKAFFEKPGSRPAA